MSEGKVVHISSDLHTTLQGFCKTHQLKMKSFVEEALWTSMEAVEEAEKKKKK